MGEHQWFHVTFSTYGTWLRGDKRGFRDHDHRIHSSGNYKTPPPEREHALLRDWTRRVMHKPPVHLSKQQRQRAGETIVENLKSKQVDLLAIAVMSDHAHLLANFPVNTARAMIGVAKSDSSRSIGAQIPGTVWAKKCLLTRMRDKDHHINTFRYIVNHRSQDAWVWTFRDPPPVCSMFT